jgi:hypothetical protein
MSINITLQDFTATIHRTSLQNGGQFDTIHVESLIVTDQPMTSEDLWYIPNAKPLNPMFKPLFQQNQITLTPTHCSAMNEKMQRASEALTVAQSGDQEATGKNMLLLAEISCMSQTTLKTVEGTSNTYILSYDYKLFPLEQNTNVYELKVILPFYGLIMPDNGDEIQITVVTPIGAVIDQTNTSGIDQNGQTIPAQYANFPNSRKQAISFQYRLDPTFTIRYNY